MLTAYAGFSPRMADIARRFFDEGWIDAPVRPGKAPGAFAHPTTPSAHPYVLVNFLGKPRDVTTLAHELGHGVHQVLAAPNGALMAPTPLTLAETASVFGEMLTFRSMLETVSDPAERKAMLAGKVEDMLNTVVRQIAFYKFERLVHLERRNGELTSERINEFWMQVQSESLGPAIDLRAGYETFWAYIGHFIHSPFYVYAYAFGDCLVNSLYGVYENAREGFAERYLAMLAAGGSKSYNELLDAVRPRRQGPGLLEHRAQRDRADDRRTRGDGVGTCGHSWDAARGRTRAGPSVLRLPKIGARRRAERPLEHGGERRRIVVAEFHRDRRHRLPRRQSRQRHDEACLLAPGHEGHAGLAPEKPRETAAVHPERIAPGVDGVVHVGPAKEGAAAARQVLARRKRQGQRQMGKLMDLVLDQQHQRPLAAVDIVFARQPDRFREQAAHERRDADHLAMLRHPIDRRRLEIEAVGLNRAEHAHAVGDAGGDPHPRCGGITQAPFAALTTTTPVAP